MKRSNQKKPNRATRRRITGLGTSADEAAPLSEPKIQKDEAALLSEPKIQKDEAALLSEPKIQKMPR
jgi:hypothetical protein